MASDTITITDCPKTPPYAPIDLRRFIPELHMFGLSVIFERCSRAGRIVTFAPTDSSGTTGAQFGYQRMIAGPNVGADGLHDYPERNAGRDSGGSLTRYQGDLSIVPISKSCFIRIINTVHAAPISI
jgi:hypothetical protein